MQEIVIKIPEEMWDSVKDGYVPLGISKYLKNGTVLPKGHGRLIDADVLVDGMEDDYEFCEAVNATLTIIEAERSEE